MDKLYPKYEEVDGIFKEAMNCRRCFDEGVGRPAFIDLAQPRWIGPNYWSSEPKILLVLLNPGAGNTRSKREKNRALREIFLKYRDGKIGLLDLLCFQKEHMREWGTPPGRFLRFYVEGIRLDLKDMALSNIAWCAEAHNRYPAAMLNQCYDLYTKRLIAALQPRVVVLSGHGTHRFESQIKKVAPEITIITTLHYAHREGNKREALELEEVRSRLRGK